MLKEGMRTKKRYMSTKILTINDMQENDMFIYVNQTSSKTNSVIEGKHMAPGFDTTEQRMGVNTGTKGHDVEGDSEEREKLHVHKLIFLFINVQ